MDKTIFQAARDLYELMPGIGADKFAGVDATLQDDHRTVDLITRFKNGSKVTVHYQLRDAVERVEDFNPMAAEKLFVAILGNASKGAGV